MTAIPDFSSHPVFRAAQMRRDCGYTLKQVEKKCGVKTETVKNAGDLLRWEMYHLVQAVVDGNLAVGTAHKQGHSAKMAGRAPQSVKPDYSHCLYLLTEEDGDTSWAKIGIESEAGVLGPKIRFDEAQRGNPRKLYLAGLWRFEDRKQAMAVEKIFKNDLERYPTVPGGKEWREGIKYSVVHPIAMKHGGRRSPIRAFNDMCRD